VGICPLPDGTVCPPPFNPPLYFDLDAYSDEAYNSIPERIRQKINLTRGTAQANCCVEETSEPTALEADFLTF
jgi:hypothetical protein